MEQDKLLKSKKKLIILLLIYLGIASALIGFPICKILSDKNKDKEAVDLSELVLNENVKEGQYVKLEIDTLPRVMMTTSKSDSKLYYVTDVNSDIYIVRLSNRTFNNIVNTLNKETGKLGSVYQIKGITNNITEQVKNVALSHSYLIFKNTELNSDNFSEYLGTFYIKENFASYRTVDVYKILVFIGVFFLVLAFGYVLPAIIKVSKGKFGIYDEENMMKALKKYVPAGETLTAGVYTVGIETQIKQVFGKCNLVGDKLIPNENGTTIQVNKKKFAKHEVYVGITQSYLILSECEKYKHYYEFNDIPDMGETTIKEIDADIPIEDIGTCFPLAEVQNCDIKNARGGAVKCLVTMENGSVLKLKIPKEGGLGMPHHTEYREAVISRLSSGNK
ncbi:MAG: hypothetical protein K2M78_15135 [Lachnospiraceae bacterium]|nr:hypothetical protein [Lachnospiraceae bacterium]